MRKQNLNARPATTTAKPGAKPTTTEQPAALMHVESNPTTPAADQDADQDAQPAAEQASPLSIAAEQPAATPAPQLAGSEDAAPAPVAAQPAPFVPMLELRTPRTMDELFEMVNQGKAITDRLAVLRNTSEKLSAFALSREGNTDRLTIRDSSGLEWSTGQTGIIAEVLTLVREKLRGTINNTEAELRQLLPAA